MLARIDPCRRRATWRAPTHRSARSRADERAAGEQVKAAAGRRRRGRSARARRRTAARARARPARHAGSFAASDLDAARAAADSAAAQLAPARAAVDRARQSLIAASRRVAQARAQQTGRRDIVSKTSIVSPIDGIVTRLRVREGEMVVIGLQNQPGTTLMTIPTSAPSTPRSRWPKPTCCAWRSVRKPTVTLEALPGRMFPGRVVEIGASALPVTGTGAAAREFKVVVRLDNPDPGCGRA